MNDAKCSNCADLQRTFDLRWKADQRAIKIWQEANPGNDLVWPDHADLVVYLLGRLSQPLSLPQTPIQGEGGSQLDALPAIEMVDDLVEAVMKIEVRNGDHVEVLGDFVYRDEIKLWLQTALAS